MNFINSIDVVWEKMNVGEMYSVVDLSKILGLKYETVSKALQFLSNYKFVERVGLDIELYKKCANVSPNDAANVLRIVKGEK